MGRIQASLVLNDRMTVVLNRVNRAMGLVLDSFEAVQKASGQSFNAAGINAARQAWNSASASLKEIEEHYQECNDQQNRLNRGISNGAFAMGGLLGKLKGVVSAYLGMKGLGGAINLSDTMTQTNARLTMMNDDSQSTQALNDMIFASAQRSRGDYLSTADAVAKWGLMAGDAFSSNTETVAFMELINKQFKIAGTSAAGIDAAMLQLTQAMGSGVLRGEEYNSILEQAPNIIQSIADYMEVPKGQLKDMAAEGKISASVVKAAMFACADETNAKFESIPKTWSDICTSMKNDAVKIMKPLLTKINELANNPRIQQAVSGLLGTFSTLVDVASGLFDAVVAVYNFIADNWSLIAPVVMGIVTAMTLYNLVTGVSSIVISIMCASQATKTSLTWAEAIATHNAAAAQSLFNAALLKCPLTWLVLGIIAVITIIIMLANCFSGAGHTAQTAFGAIAGGFLTLGAGILNALIGVANSIIQCLWTAIAVPLISIFEWIFNAFSGGFDSFGAGIQNLLGNIISWFLSLGMVVTQIIDAIFGTNWTDGLTSLQDNVLAWGKTENAVNISREAPTFFEHIDYSDAYTTGAKWGDGIADKFNKAFENDSKSPFDDYDNLLKNNGITADNTTSIADSMNASQEDLKYLRDIAERDVINRFTTAEIRIEQTNNNTISSDTDIDGIMEKWNDDFTEILEIAAEGE